MKRILIASSFVVMVTLSPHAQSGASHDSRRPADVPVVRQLTGGAIVVEGSSRAVADADGPGMSDGAAARIGTITIAGQTVTITQPGGCCYSVSPPRAPSRHTAAPARST
jgi:hypothetical protein